MFQNIINWLKAFWTNHICAEFPKDWPQECFMCNAGSCDGCSVHKYPDSLGDLDEEENINWSSGQDDVPRAPDGIVVFSEGKASKAYIEAKDTDIRAADDRVVRCLNHLCGNTEVDQDYLADTLREAHSCLMRAQL
jgi:hypothetical protein